MKILTDEKGIAIQDSDGRLRIEGEGEKVKLSGNIDIPGDSPVVLSDFHFESTSMRLRVNKGGQVGTE